MAIQNVGSMSNLLKNYNAADWSKSADLGVNKSFNLTEAPTANIEQSRPTKSFSELLADSITGVNKLQGDANTAIESLATGRSKNLHETMLAVEKADIAFRSMNQIRLKVIDAYKEIMRMQM